MKWRTTWGSDTSGSAAGVRRKRAGGTWRATVRRRDIARGPGQAGAAGHAFFKNQRFDHGLAHRAASAISSPNWSMSALVLSSVTHTSSWFLSVGVVVPVVAGQHAFHGQLFNDLFGRGGTAHRELVEERMIENRRETPFREDLAGVVGLLEIELRQLLKTAFAHQRQVNRGRQGAQGLVRADVGGRSLPADVLFPGLEREHEGAAAILSTVWPTTRPGILRINSLRQAKSPR